VTSRFACFSFVATALPKRFSA